MTIFESPESEWTHRMHGIFRIVVGLLFLEHGTQKLFGFPHWPIASIHLMSELGMAGILETVGGVAILIGLMTRPVAFVLAGEMAVAYFQQHFPKSFYPVVNGGELAILFCFSFLYLVFAGAGEWSIDAALARTRRAHRPSPSNDRSYAHPR